MRFGVAGRPAAPAPAWWNIAKTLLQTSVFWTVFLALLPAGIYALENWLGWEGLRFHSSLAQRVGAALFVVGGSLGLCSGWLMAKHGQGTPLPLDCPRRLVIVGPYRLVRNPMAIAGLSQGLAVGLMLGSPAVVAYALVGGPVWHVFVRPWEEQDLADRFGAEYERYRRAVRCWIPRWPGYSGDPGSSRPSP